MRLARLIEWKTTPRLVRAKHLKTNNRQKKEASGLGTATHKLVENYLLKEESKPKGNLVWQMAEKISKPIITNLHVHMDELWGVECTLFYPGLYAGTSDCVAVYKGEPAILDFKTSKDFYPDMPIQIHTYKKFFY